MAHLETPHPGSALVVGVGPGLGASLCRALAGEGYAVFGAARSLSVESALHRTLSGQIPGFRGFAIDSADVASVHAMVDEIEATAPLTALVFNASGFHQGAFDALDPMAFEAVWRTSCYGAFVAAHACLPRMAARGAGTALFTGATASLRGGANFSAFASAKFALRGLVQSLARSYWPRGVHVAHAILDGLIGEREAQLHPDAIASAYLAIMRQPRPAWTLEFDLRPNNEGF